MKLFRAPLAEELHVDAVLLAENIASVTGTFPPVVLAAPALTLLTEVAPVKGKLKTYPFCKSLRERSESFPLKFCHAQIEARRWIQLGMGGNRSRMGDRLLRAQLFGSQTLASSSV